LCVIQSRSVVTSNFHRVLMKNFLGSNPQSYSGHHTGGGNRVFLDWEMLNYIRESLKTDHIWQRAWRVPHSMQINDLFCRFRKRVGTL